MYTEEALLREVVANPHDPTIRLVYADWLEEQGDPRAEFLRLEAELTTMPEDDSRYAPSFARLRQLWKTLDRDWLAQVNRSPVENCHFEFQCPKKWEQLEVTEQAGVRLCNTCSCEVYYCQSIPEARRIAGRGGCIALDIRIERQPGDVPETEHSNAVVGLLDDEEDITMGLVYFDDDSDETEPPAVEPHKPWWKWWMFWV
jgi:uncharacterized protein (TIGR02996 family)